MSKVDRGIYQKAIEENKRLLADIKILVMKRMTAEWVLCSGRWKEKFEKDAEFNRLLKIAAKTYFKTKG